MNNILDKRRAGVLLHITSLPSTLGNGTMGKHAYRFVDFLSECGFSVWQVLPIHPPHQVPLRTPHRDFLSPYQPQSIHAGNPQLINLQKVIEKDWLPQTVLPKYCNKKQLTEAHKYRLDCLKDAYSYFKKSPDYKDYKQFIKKNNWWLDDYALFCVLKDFYSGACWWNWPNSDYRNYKPEAINEAREHFADKIEQYQFIQFLFFSQWQELKEYAHENGVYLFGDMPFFVAHDSVEVWSNKELFLLDEQNNPLFISGNPPENDFFRSNTGQCWGNPIYNWDKLHENDFQWWINRFKIVNQSFDLIRLTHFKGFYKYWAILNNDNPKPCNGKWQYSYGKEFFDKLKVFYSSLALIAEDIGACDGSIKLRDEFDLLGMKILQLGFNTKVDTPLRNCHLLHHHLPNYVVYTGTHDSNTTIGWFGNTKTFDENKAKYICDYLNSLPDDVPCSLVRAALQSVAKLAIIPFQDILHVGSKHRMNTPGKNKSCNWRWQFDWSQLEPDAEEKLKDMVKKYERC